MPFLVNSTNDRSFGLPPFLRGALALLSRAAPSLAAEAVSRLFLRVPGAAPLRGEAAAFLASGEPFRVPHGGRRLAAWSWGRGPAVVLVHGWGGRGAQMRAFVPALVDAGYRAVTFDGPGHGLTGGRSSSLPALADAVAAVCRATNARGAVAHSMGGASTLLAVARGLELSRVVVVGAPSNAERIWNGFSAALRLPVPVAEEARRRLEARVGESFGGLNAASFGPRVGIPVLVVHDREDAEVPWSAGEENARALPAGRLVTTRGLGHRRVLRDGAVVAQAVRFLEEGIVPDRCEGCAHALGSAGTGTLCGSCVVGRELFDAGGRFATFGRAAAASSRGA